MRKIHQSTPSLLANAIDHSHAKELEEVANLLDENPTIAELALQDLVAGLAFPQRGAPGMSADEVVRAAVLKQLHQCSYEDLAYELRDSITARRFMRYGMLEKGPEASALQDNVAKLSPATWEAINRVLLGVAKDEGIEDGKKVRYDCTPVDSNIHHPEDSSLLFDVVRVLVRLMNGARDLEGEMIEFHDHARRAKRRSLKASTAANRNRKKSIAAYRDLVYVTEKTLGYADAVVRVLRMRAASFRAGDGSSNILVATREQLANRIEHFATLGRQVVDQTRRRLFKAEQVPAAEKIVSIFEPHTDIIIKDNRETHFGHKICLAAGASSMILDCVVEEGNPADSTLVQEMLERTIDIYSAPPKQVALDGGFASRANLHAAKGMHVEDVCFSKGRGIEVLEMVRSTWLYKKLWRFRAGIEGVISFLKRCFGLGRCLWRGWEHFKSYVWSSVVSCNLLMLARHRLAAQQPTG